MCKRFHLTSYLLPHYLVKFESLAKELYYRGLQLHYFILAIVLNVKH